MLHFNWLYCVALPDLRPLSFKHANYGNTLFTYGPRDLDWNNNDRHSKPNAIICKLKVKGMVAFSSYARHISMFLHHASAQEI